MKSTIANWLLTLGVVVGALAAAGSKKAFRVVDLDPTVDLSNEVLYEDETTQRVPTEDPIVIAKQGAPLDVVAVTNLRNANVERVRVRHPARDAESVPREEAAGRVLAESIVLEGKTETLQRGRLLTKSVVERARDAGVEALQVLEVVDGEEITRAFLTMDAPEPVQVGDPYDETYWDLSGGYANATPAVGPDAPVIAKLKLAEALELPARLAKDAFLDAERIDALAAQGVETVQVKTRVPFTWDGWTQRWWFLAAVGLVVVAIALKRSAPTLVHSDEHGETPVQAVRNALVELVREAEELSAGAPSLDADALHRAIDPIHSGSLYRVVEGRETAKAVLGLHAYAEVYGPLATGERALNRAWSAAVDGYLDEARDCATKAAPHLRSALDAWPGGDA